MTTHAPTATEPHRDTELEFERRGVLVSGGWTCANRGDWALGEAAIENLRRAHYPGRVLLQAFHDEVDWPIAEPHDPIAMWSKRRPRRHKALSFGVRRLYYRAQRADIVRHLRDARSRFADQTDPPLLWITGGGIMNDVASHGRFTSRLGLIAADEGWEVVMTGQTVGPFKQADSKQQFEDFARQCTYLSVRDPDSFEYVSSISGLRAKPRRVLDDVFTMLPPSGGRDELERLLPCPIPEGPFIAVTVHQQGGTSISADWDAILAGCDRALDAGLGVVLVTFAGNPEPADEIQRRYADSRERAVFVDHTVSVPALRLLCAHAEFVITTRFHGLVFSFHAGTPAIGTYAGQYYKFKSYRIMEEWGLADLAIDISGGWGGLPDLVDTVRQDTAVWRRTLQEHRPEAVGQINTMLTEHLATR